MDNIKIINSLPVERWQEYKNLRLEALKEENLAFGASLEEEIKKDDEYWMKLLKTSSRENSHQKVSFAEVNGKLAGMGIIFFGFAKKFSHIARFSGIYVKPEFRGKGIASKLYESRIQEAFSRPNIHKIKLIVNKTQEAAVNLYKKFGFEIVGDLKDEFKINDKFYDAYLMEKFKDQKTR